MPSNFYLGGAKFSAVDKGRLLAQRQRDIDLLPLWPKYHFPFIHQEFCENSADGRAEEEVWCFAVENQVSKVECFLSFKLLLNRGAIIFAVTKGLVTTTVLDLAG